MLVGRASAPAPAPESVGSEIGLAELLCGPLFHAQQTASGERYDQVTYAAAHRRLPFGALVQVTRIDNGETVEVRINERSPFVKGRVIDLSYPAAKKLGIFRKGVVSVKVVRVD